MAVTATLFGQQALGQYSATAARRIDFVGDTIKCSLHTATYTPNQDTDVFFTAATNELGAGNGYTVGGVALTTKTVTYDSATNQTRFDCDDIAWTGLTATFRIAVIYKDTGTGSTSPLFGWVDFGANQTVSSASFSIVIDPLGLAYIQAA